MFWIDFCNGQNDWLSFNIKIRTVWQRLIVRRWSRLTLPNVLDSVEYQKLTKNLSCCLKDSDIVITWHYLLHNALESGHDLMRVINNVGIIFCLDRLQVLPVSKLQYETPSRESHCRRITWLREKHFSRMSSTVLYVQAILGICIS